VLSRAVTSEHAAKVLEEMEVWLAQGELPGDAAVREFLENLAIDQLIALAGQPGRELLRHLTLFSLPVPEAVIENMAGKMGASPARLRDLGLVDRHEDLVDPHMRAVAANALAAARVAALDDDEQKAWRGTYSPHGAAPQRSPPGRRPAVSSSPTLACWRRMLKSSQPAPPRQCRRSAAARPKQRRIWVKPRSHCSIRSSAQFDGRC
jgi:hypothetical protein